MNVLLIGATGFSGREVLRELLAQQHNVTVITRNTSYIDPQLQPAKVIEGSVLDAALVDQAVISQDAVISCLGIGGKGNATPNSLVSDATQILVAAMEKHEVKRLITMSNVGAGDSYGFQPWFFTKVILPFFMKWLKVIIDDKNVMEPIIMGSHLDWTILRFPNIVDRPPKGNVTISFDGKGLKQSITNREVAALMVTQLHDQSLVHAAPCVSN